MRKKDVLFDKTYLANVSKKLVYVRITRDCPYGGWLGKNLSTGHEVHIKTAGRLKESNVR